MRAFLSDARQCETSSHHPSRGVEGYRTKSVYRIFTCATISTGEYTYPAPPLPRLDLQSKMLQTIKHSIRVDKNKVKKLGKMFKFKKNISNVL